MKTVKFELSNSGAYICEDHLWEDMSGGYVKAETAQKIQELADSRLYLLSQIKLQVDVGLGLDVGDNLYKLIEKELKA